MRLVGIYEWVAREDLAALKTEGLKVLLDDLLSEMMSIVRQWYDWDDQDQAQSYLSFLVHTISRVRGEINARVDELPRRLHSVACSQPSYNTGRERGNAQT